MNAKTKTQNKLGYNLTDLRLIDKTALKERINHTQLKTDHSFIIHKWKSGDEQLPMFYTIEDTRIGEVLIAATEKGVTYLGFVNNDMQYILHDLKKRFPDNVLIDQDSKWLNLAFDRINEPSLQSTLSLHLKGTEFQYNIWEKLIMIPKGGLLTYGSLSKESRDARAVGGAVGANPVSYFIPCHRVVRSDGSFNGYFWGNDKKEKLLIYEMSNVIGENQ